MTKAAPFFLAAVRAGRGWRAARELYLIGSIGRHATGVAATADTRVATVQATV